MLPTPAPLAILRGRRGSDTESNRPQFGAIPAALTTLAMVPTSALT